TGTLVCGDVPNNAWLAHEFGHYMGLTHTFAEDYVTDTRPDGYVDGVTSKCLAPHTPTGNLNGSLLDTNNPMSYYYNVAMKISPMQAGVTRTAAFVRGY